MKADNEKSPSRQKIPNDETLEAMREARDPDFLKNATRYNSVDELFDDFDL